MDRETMLKDGGAESQSTASVTGAAPAWIDREPCNFAVGYRQAVRDVITAVVIAYAVYVLFSGWSEVK